MGYNKTIPVFGRILGKDGPNRDPATRGNILGRQTTFVRPAKVLPNEAVVTLAWKNKSRNMSAVVTCGCSWAVKEFTN